MFWKDLLLEPMFKKKNSFTPTDFFKNFIVTHFSANKISVKKVNYDLRI